MKKEHCVLILICCFLMAACGRLEDIPEDLSAFPETERKQRLLSRKRRQRRCSRLTFSAWGIALRRLRISCRSACFAAAWSIIRRGSHAA